MAFLPAPGMIREVFHGIFHPSADVHGQDQKQEKNQGLFLQPLKSAMFDSRKGVCGPDIKGDLWWVRPNLPSPRDILSSCCSPNLSAVHRHQCPGWEMLNKGCHPAVTAKGSAFLSGKMTKFIQLECWN